MRSVGARLHNTCLRVQLPSEYANRLCCRHCPPSSEICTKWSSEVILPLPVTSHQLSLLLVRNWWSTHLFSGAGAAAGVPDHRAVHLPFHMRLHFLPLCRDIGLSWFIDVSLQLVVQTAAGAAAGVPAHRLVHLFLLGGARHLQHFGSGSCQGAGGHPNPNPAQCVSVQMPLRDALPPEPQVGGCGTPLQLATPPMVWTAAVAAARPSPCHAADQRAHRCSTVEQSVASLLMAAGGGDAMADGQQPLCFPWRCVFPWPASSVQAVTCSHRRRWRNC